MVVRSNAWWIELGCAWEEAILKSNVHIIVGAVVLGLGYVPAWSQETATKPNLKMSTAVAADSLAFEKGQNVRFELTDAGLASWAEANVAFWVIRSASGQKSLVPEVLTLRSREFNHRFDDAGAHLVVLSVGPEALKGKSSSWQEVTHCTKLFVDVRAPGGEATRKPFAGATAKVGQRFEIVPLLDPFLLRIGSDLPVRVFFDFEKMVQGTVIAIRPDGSIDRQTTDSAGAANFTITQPGRWVIRMEGNLEGLKRVAEVVFEIREAKPKGDNP